MDKELLERMPKRFTRMVNGLRLLPYIGKKRGKWFRDMKCGFVVQCV